jgi:hypothetical protein
MVWRMALIRRALALAATLSIAQGALAALWVSPAGDDLNPGTEEQPVRTIERARDIVRTLNADMSDDITVFISGTHRLLQPIEFGTRDSGTNGFSVVYTAAPGEHPVLTGGFPVTGWVIADRARNLWSAPAPDGLANTRDLFINGSPASRTRLRLSHTEPQTQEDATRPDAWALWKNPADVELASSAAGSIWSERSGPPPYYAENALEILTTPGEWYFDRSARLIYYMPRHGEDMASADVVAASAGALLVGRGSGDRPLLGLIFKGIRFEYTSGTGPTSNSAEEPPAAVSLSNSGDVQFLEDEFVHMGTPALQLGPMLTGCTIEGCLYGDLSWTALRITEAARVTVASSRFSYVSTGSSEAAPIEIAHSSDVGINHCQLDHFPTTAIAVSGSSASAVRDEMNLVAPPIIERDTRRAPALGSGIPADYGGLMDERLSPPATPHAPTKVSAEPVDGAAYVTWDPPCNDGGQPVLSYSVASSTGATAAISAKDFMAKGFLTFPNLENGQPAAFTVTALNSLGSSPPSVSCAAVVPGRRRHLKVPPAPAQVTVSAGAPLGILITPSASSGGSPVVAYSLDVLPSGAHLVLEGRDIIHSDSTHPLARVLPDFSPAPGSQVAVTATNIEGQGKPLVVRWP